MKITRLAVMLAMAVASLLAGQRALTARATVIVCMESDPHDLMGVRPLAAAMFARIGVKVDWREPDSCPVSAGVVRVRLTHDSTLVRDSGAEALAYAQPYAGTIVLFLDRVHALNHDGGPFVMAHVLVHEITHVIEGIDRHSTGGIMKARWSRDDYLEMRRKGLVFAQEDVDLICAALKISRAAVAGL